MVCKKAVLTHIMSVRKRMGQIVQQVIMKWKILKTFVQSHVYRSKDKSTKYIKEK